MTTLEFVQTQHESLVPEVTRKHYLLETARNVGSFVLDRFTLRGDHQVGKQTDNPVYFHESYPLHGMDIVLGEE